MTLDRNERELHPLLAAVLALQRTGQHTQAVATLAGQDAYFYDTIDLKLFYLLFMKFLQEWHSTAVNQPTESSMSLATTPSPIFVIDHSTALPTAPATEVTAHLHYLQALWLRRNGELLQANAHFIQAKMAYAIIGQQAGVTRSTLELARLARLQEGWSSANRYLTEEVQPLVEQKRLDDSLLQAHCYLQMADVARDQGDWLTGARYAQQALHHYQELAHSYGQLLAQVWLATYALSRGDYDAADSHLQEARQQGLDGPLGVLAEARLLQGELLLAWYQRLPDVAFSLAQKYLLVADSESYCAERIEVRLLLGNLYRDSGDYRAAHRWYDDTRLLIEQLGYHGYIARLQVEMAWLCLLEGELQLARTLIDPLPEGRLPIQRATAQVIWAVLHMMDGEWEAADALLKEAYLFYEKAGDALAVCALHFYRAYSALHQSETAPVLQHLEQALGWLNTRGLTTLPHWWHPKILADVCTHALLSNLYPELVAQILVQHLGKASLPFLKLLETTDDLELRRQALRLQQVITGGADPLAHLPASPSKRVIERLLAQGDLRAEAYHELESELMTAANRLTPNPTIIAVFGLYIKGVTRTAIATELACSTENVRNYITMIYNHFGLPAYRFHKRETRRQKLIEVAQMRGFIY